MATFADGPTANSTSSGGTLALTGVTAAVGTVAIIACAADNAGTSGVSSTSSSITDGAGNTWTMGRQTTNSPGGAANDGTTLTIWTSVITSALVAATLTINFSPNTTAKAAAMQIGTPAAGCTLAVDSVGPGVTGSNPSRTTGSVSVNIAQTIIGACAVETSDTVTADSDTTNGSWSTALTAVATGGGLATSQTILAQRKTATATGGQTFNTSSPGNRDAAINYVIVYESTSGSLAATDTTDTAAFAGIVGLAGVMEVTEPADTADFEGSGAIMGAMAATDRRDRASFSGGASWPTELPYPTLQGYAVQPASAVERRPMEIGAPRVYRRTKRPTVEVSVAWQLSADQQAILDEFQSVTLQQGALWFGVTLAFPSGLVSVSARFKDKFVIKARGGPRWQTTATLELLDRPVMSEAALTALLDDDGDPPAWPLDLLPYPTVDSWELTPKPATVRTDDSLPGLPQARQRSRNSTTEVPAGWELSATEAAIFDAFFRWRAKDGAQWFDFPVVQAAGEAMTMVRFLGDVDWTPRGNGRWAVTAAIEIRERPVSAAPMLDFSVPENSQYVPLV